MGYIIRFLGGITMILGMICISITIFFALWAGSYCKKVVLPMLGVVSLTALSIVAGLIEYGILGKGIGEGTVFFIGILGVSIHPLILLLFVHQRAWSSVYLILFTLINTLVNLYIFDFEWLELALRLGMAVPYAMYTPLAFAIWMGLIAVRDCFALKETVGTAISTAVATYLPITVFALWKSHPVQNANSVLLSIPFLFIAYIALFVGTALIYKKLRARKQQTPA